MEVLNPEVSRVAERLPRGGIPDNETRPLTIRAGEFRVMPHESDSSSFPAKGFPPELAGEPVPGRIVVGPGGVRFEPEGGVKLPLAGLRVTREVGGGEVWLEHPDQPGWRIACADPALADHPALHHAGGAKSPEREAARPAKDRPRPLVIVLGLIAIAGGIILLLLQQREWLVYRAVDRIPIAWEQRLGDRIYQRIASEGRMVRNGPWNQRLIRISDRLLPVLEQTPYTIRFHVMEGTNVNAFAIPGGRVIILTGLLEAVESAEEVAGLLAHEIAHMTERHTMRAVVEEAGLPVILKSLFGDATNATAIIAEKARFLTRGPFSRAFEREADNEAWAWLVEAEIDPRGLINFLKRMEATQDSLEGEPPEMRAFLNTHPPAPDRIAHLERKWQEIAEKDRFVPIELEGEEP